MSKLYALMADVERLGVTLDKADRDALTWQATPVHVAAGDHVQSQARVADVWIFLAGGIVASEQTWQDGTTTIARFFEPGAICANFTSIWTQDIAADDLVALQDVTGLAIPDAYFRQQYLQGGAFGQYLRLKMIEAHLFAKELICAKTSGRTEVRYAFLEHHHRTVIGSVPQKDIARFLGVTPQGLSRFLRRRMLDPS